MGIIKNFRTMNPRQKLRLKMQLRSFFTHPLVVFSLGIIGLFLLHITYAAV